MNGALGKDGAFELVKVAGDLRVVTGFDKTIFQDISELEVAAFDQSEKLSRTWVNMRRVDATGFEEPDSGTNAEIGENRETLNVLNKTLVGEI